MLKLSGPETAVLREFLGSLPSLPQGDTGDLVKTVQRFDEAEHQMLLDIFESLRDIVY